MKLLFISFSLLLSTFLFAKSNLSVEPYNLLFTNNIKSNYNYFSKVLVYPLNVNDNLNILNSGSNHFKLYIYDSNQKLIISIDSSPYCSSIINISTFESGKYIIKADNASESHQFIFYKN